MEATRKIRASHSLYSKKIRKPTAYDVMAGLTCGLEFTEEHQIDDFCDCFGYSTEYTSISYINETFKRAIKQNREVLAFFDDKEIEELQDIN